MIPNKIEVLRRSELVETPPTNAQIEMLAISPDSEFRHLEFHYRNVKIVHLPLRDAVRISKPKRVPAIVEEHCKQVVFSARGLHRVGVEGEQIRVRRKLVEG